MIIFGTIDRILKDPASNRLTSRQVELAYCYADLYFNHWYPDGSLAVAVSLGRHEGLAYRRILSEEGQKEFGPVLDELVNGPAAGYPRHE